MRPIRKQRQPAMLAEYAQRHPGDWSALTTDDKAKLRQQLVNEQAGLCAYCMDRVSLDPTETKIEHIVPQTDATRVFEWSNLVACCQGKEGRPRREQTCDTHKRDTVLTALDVLRPQQIRYGRGSGEIASSDPAVNRELNEVLNLNAELLRNNRKKVIEGLTQSLRRLLGTGTWSTSKLSKYLRDERAKPTLDPYFGVVEYFVERMAR